MSFDKRIERLEMQRREPGEGLVQFKLLVPPPGLSREAHEAWLNEERKAGPTFTLDLGAASLARLHE